MIERTSDAALVNALAGEDFTDFLAEPLHVCLIDGESGALFAWRGPGIYETHLFYTVKGRAALDLCADMLAEMRGKHGARMFWALIPTDRPHVRLFARLMGWKSKGVLQTGNGPNELFVENGECLQRS